MFKVSLPIALNQDTLHEENFEARFEQSDLLKALVNVCAAQGENELNWIHMDFPGEGRAVLTAMNRFMSIQSQITANYSGEGAIFVSGKQLLDYVKQLPSNEVVISADIPTRMTVRCGRSHARMQLIQESRVPELNFQPESNTIKVKGAVLERWINSFREFVMVDETRFYANGALIGLNDGEKGLFAVATDSLRLAYSELDEDLEIINSVGGNVIVPRRTWEEVKRAANQEPDTIFEVSWKEGTQFFGISSPSYKLVCSCIAGKYPAWTAVVPKAENVTIPLPRKEVLDSLKRVLLFSDKHKVVRFQFNDKILKIQCFTPGLKEGEETIELDNPVPKSFEVNFSGGLMQGVLTNVLGDTVNFAWEDTAKQVKITGEDERGLNSFYLLVPTRY